jgi:DNA repair photolyase
VDVLQYAASKAETRVSFSIPTLDDRVWRTTEPGTAPPRQRLRALRTLVEAGIDVGVAVAPILPGLSDDPSALEAVVKAARDAGATSLWARVLDLRPGTREHFLDALARDWPEQAPYYAALYKGRTYLDDRRAQAIVGEVMRLRDEIGIADLRALRIEPRRTEMQLPLAI